MKVLECHSRGDKRFSALFAQVLVNGKRDSIENHYQLSKRIYGKDKPKNWKELKGKKVHYFVLNNKKIPISLLSEYYRLLWVKYFQENPELLDYAKTFDTFRDIFKGTSINSQDTIIRDIVNLGLDKNIINCSNLINFLKSKEEIVIINKDLLCANENIIGHQVNCKGVMGSGIAKQIKDKYPLVFNAYKKKCSFNGSYSLGDCQLIQVEENKYISNIFGQDDYGKNKMQTNLHALEKSLQSLKKQAITLNLSIALPYNIGCGLGGGKWEDVYKLLLEIFKDYPIILYKK